MIKIVWQRVLEILFPPICLNCRGYLQDGEAKENLLCATCFGGIKIYSNIFRPDPQIHLIAIGSYENSALRELIHCFKYNGFLGAKIPIEKLILKWLNANPNLIPSFPAPEGRGSPNSWAANSLIVPIPLHKSRLRTRGFNQAELIAEILGRHLHLPLEKDLLERVRNTESQIKMKSEKDRRENIKDSIRVKPDKETMLSKYPQLILVDDVYTSGATIEEAVKVLRRAGAKNITAFAVAKT